MAEEINIKSAEELKAWLVDKPVEWSQMIALRAALRVFPFTTDVIEDRTITKNQKQGLILQTWRAMFISSVARKYPTDDMRRAAAAASAASAASAAASAAAFAATRAASAVSAATRAAFAAASAAAEAADAAGAADAAVWEAISCDCRLLENDGSIKPETPLWLAIDPANALNNKTEFAIANPGFIFALMDSLTLLTDQLGPSAVLIGAWYAPWFNGIQKLFEDQRGETLALKPNEFWKITDDRTVEQIMDECAEVLGWNAKPQNASNAELANFIVKFLNDTVGTRTIDNIRDELRASAMNFVDSSLRRTLGNLADTDKILRVKRGVYQRFELDKEPARETEPDRPTQGNGFAYRAVNNALDRIPTIPDASDLQNPTQQKLLDRLKKRLKAFQIAMGNGLGQYPVLATSIDDYCLVLNIEVLAELQIDDLWMTGTGVIAQARSFAALNPSEHLTQPLEPQQQALLGEIAHLHGAFIMGFAKGRELVETSAVPLLTQDEFNKLLEHERAIVRWLLVSDQYKISDSVRSILEIVDHNLSDANESTYELVRKGYPVVRNLLIFTGEGLSKATKVAGSAALLGVPVHLAVHGTLAFLVANYSHIVGFAASAPEVQAYLKFHLDRLELEYLAEQTDSEKDQ